MQGSPGGIRDSYPCGFATGTREYLFNTYDFEDDVGVSLCTLLPLRIFYGL